MSKEAIFDCLGKVRRYAEQTKHDDLLDAVEDAEKVAIEEVLGLTYVEGKPLEYYLSNISTSSADSRES